MAQTKGQLRWDLRDETRETHERLDAKVSVLDLTTARGLSSFLIGNALAHDALCAFDDTFEGHMLRRLQLLRADMASLHVQPPETTLNFTPPDFDTGPGWRYVIAGSAMGGKILARRHAAAKDPRVSQAGTFLRDESLGLFWKDVQAELCSLPRSAEVRAAVIAGANACFSLFDAAFDAALTQAKHV